MPTFHKKIIQVGKTVGPIFFWVIINLINYFYWFVFACVFRPTSVGYSFDVFFSCISSFPLGMRVKISVKMEFPWYHVMGCITFLYFILVMQLIMYIPACQYNFLGTPFRPAACLCFTQISIFKSRISSPVCKHGWSEERTGFRDTCIFLFLSEWLWLRSMGHDRDGMSRIFFLKKKKKSNLVSCHPLNQILEFFN